MGLPEHAFIAEFEADLAKQATLKPGDKLEIAEVYLGSTEYLNIAGEGLVLMARAVHPDGQEYYIPLSGILWEPEDPVPEIASRLSTYLPQLNEVALQRRVRTAYDREIE